MSTFSLESRSDVDAPLEAALAATPLPQDPARFSQFSLNSIRLLLELKTARRPQSLEQLLPALRILGLSVVAGIGQGIGQLLAQVRLTGLEAGDHGDDAIEQSIHGFEG